MRRSRARRGRSKWVLRSLAVGALVLIGVLYYKPVRSYFETRSALTDRQAEVQELRRQRAVLRQQLAASTSLEALGAGGAPAGVRQARRAPVHRQGHPGVAEAQRYDRRA